LAQDIGVENLQNQTKTLPILEAGRDYPRIYREFVEWFPDDESCIAYLEKLRWPSGFICPVCDFASDPWHQTRGRLVCPNCRRQTSATRGTIFDKTRTPLTVWFETAWLMTTAKNGLSAKTLNRTLGTSYRTAWSMLHRYRIAMVRSEREKLSGFVEIDESLVGGVDHGGKRGRGSDKAIVVIAVEIKEPKGYGRIRMRHIPNASGDSLVPFVCDVVSSGATIQTDGWNGYNDLQQKGYVHQKKKISASDDPAHVSMPGVHRIASLLKRWILGTHQGAVRVEHLQAYLEEFTFRFNRRTSQSRGLVFRRLLEQAVVTDPIIEKKITHGFDWDNHNI
jgi:transposase-like protein